MAESRVALVTGVGRAVGIGAGIARQLAIDGWDIAFTYWSPYDRSIQGETVASDPAAIEEELRARGARVVSVEADFAQAEAPAETFATVVASLGPVSAIVLSHTEGVDSSILTTTLESFDRHFDVNVRANWLLISEFARQIPEGGGSIVALTSDHVVDNLPYGASKGALDRIVIAAARELAPLGIRANVVNPGPIDTGWMDEPTRAWLTGRQPTGRLGTPQDTANLVSFLLSDKGAWVSGQLVKSDGGFSVYAG